MKVKGYCVKVYPIELGGIPVEKGFATHPEALHYARKLTKGFLKWEVYHPNGHLMNWNDLKENKEVGLTDFYKQNPVGGQEFLQKADEAVKSALVLLHIPFTISNVREVESTLGKYSTFIAMDIHLSDSNEYQQAIKMANLETAYSLTISGSPTNVKLMNEELIPHFADTDKQLVLAKAGNAYVFNEAE